MTNFEMLMLSLLRVVSKFDRGVEKKPAIPKDKPIHGLVSDKNFIVANAVENILAGKCTIFKKTGGQTVVTLSRFEFNSWPRSAHAKLPQVFEP